MEKPKFYVSLMCADFLHLGDQLASLNDLVDGFHCDIMDGHYCKNITMSPDLIAACAKAATKPMDVHLMTTEPENWLEPCAAAGVSVISPHAETINVNAFRTIQKIRELGCQVGVTLNPATPLSACAFYLDQVDLLTIMTVDVGYAGQPFIEAMLPKIREAKRLREEKGYHYEILIDGSCNQRTFGKLYEAGADSFVLGSSGLFGLDPDVKVAAQKMRAIFSKETGVIL